MTTANFIKRSKGYDKSAKTITDIYQVQVDAANDTDDAIAAVEAKSVPAGYFTDSVNASHINRNPFWYEVTATYKQTISGGGSGVDDPLDRPSVLSASYEEWTEGYDIDFTAPTPKPVTNSAGDPFQAYPQRKNGRLVLQITKNFAAFNAVGYDAIKFTTNAAGVTIKGTLYAAKTLLLLPPTAQEVWEQIGSTTHNYFSITFRLEVDAVQHVHKVADRGYRQVSSGEPFPILDGNGNPTEEPWPLNGSGAPLALGATPAELTFLPYQSASWGIDFS